MTTTWTSLNGPQEHTSTRNPGESDAHWIARHFNEVAVKMKVEKPIP